LLWLNNEIALPHRVRQPPFGLDRVAAICGLPVGRPMTRRQERRA
jgi:hypothetical protein